MKHLAGLFVVVVAMASLAGCAGATRAPASASAAAKRHDPYALLVVTDEDASKVGTTRLSDAVLVAPSTPRTGLLAMAVDDDEPSVQTWGLPFELDLSEIPDTRE